jgi:pyridoxine 5'-phosphate synthase PdxJ
MIYLTPGRLDEICEKCEPVPPHYFLFVPEKPEKATTSAGLSKSE